MKIKFNFFDGKTLEFEVPNKSILIGKSEECDIVLDVDGFSRKHCKIDVEAEDIFITDLNSTNGTEINDEELKPNEKVLYRPFLPLRIGPTESVEIEL